MPAVVDMPCRHRAWGELPGAGAQLQPHARELHGQVLALARLRLVDRPRKLRSAHVGQPAANVQISLCSSSHNTATQVPLCVKKKPRAPHAIQHPGIPGCSSLPPFPATMESFLALNHKPYI